MKGASFGLSVLLAAIAGSTLAQTPFYGSIKCPKSDTTQSVEVGDQAGHILIVEKGSCTPTLELAGPKSTAYTVLIPLM
jgi:hypothetical protein